MAVHGLVERVGSGSTNLVLFEKDNVFSLVFWSNTGHVAWEWIQKRIQLLSEEKPDKIFSVFVVLLDGEDISVKQIVEYQSTEDGYSDGVELSPGSIYGELIAKEVHRLWPDILENWDDNRKLFLKWTGQKLLEYHPLVDLENK
jgi:hypothetical protein